MTSPSSKHALITLFRGWDEKGRYVWSPFVTKLELRLRLSNVSYRTAAGSPRHAPKGKIPYVDIREQNQVISIGDSSLIPEYLEEHGLIEDLNANLDARGKVQDLAMKALMEDRLYFYNAQERWIDNYYTQRDKILEALPWLPRVLIGNLIYRRQVQVLYGQGTGRFSEEEIQKLREEVWTTLNGLLEDSRRRATSAQGGKGDSSCFWCLGGDGPTECDTTVFGFITSALLAKSGPASAAIVRNQPAVTEYARRIHEKYFPDYEFW